MLRCVLLYQNNNVFISKTLKTDLFSRIVLLTIFLSISCLLQANILKTKVSLEVSNTPLHEVLVILEKKTNISFAYTTNAIKQNRPITLQVQNFPLEHILKILLFDDGARYTAIDRQIIIFQPNTTIQSEPQIAKGITPVRDTIWTQITNSVHVYDTNWVDIVDTITIYDTSAPPCPKIICNRKHNQKAQSFVMVESNLGYSPTHTATNTDINFDKGSWLEWGALALFGKESDHWSVATGVGYKNISTTRPFSFTTEYDQLVTDSTPYIYTHIDTSYIILPGVDTNMFVIETDEIRYDVTHRTEHIKNTTEAKLKTNTEYICFPLNVGYNGSLSRKTTLYTSVQLQTNILLGSAEPYTIRSQNDYIRITPNPIFLSGIVSTSLGLQLSKDSQFLTGIQAQSALTPVFETENISPQNPLILTLTLGLKKNF